MKFIIIFKNHNINFVKIINVGPKKPKLVLKIKHTMLLEQLYYIYIYYICVIILDPKVPQKGAL